MREIKFRAWDSDNGKWLLGYDLPNLGGFSMFGEVMAFGEWCKVLSDTSIKNWDSIKLMQFTGLQDKDGTDIYEGDILSERWKCEVYKCNKTGAYMVRFGINPSVNKPRTLYDFLKDRKRAGTIERDGLIIGKIHEDKHLIDNTK